MSEFDKFAGQYETLHRQNLGRLAEDPTFFDEHKVMELKKYLEGVEKGPSLRLLDFGCSIAKSYGHFKKHLPDLEYHGIDPSSESITLAAQRVVGKDVVCLFDGKKIPYKDAHFDIIFVSCVVHHIPPAERIEIFVEMKRVLKPQGLIFIVEHNPFNPLTQYMVKTCPFDEDAHLLSIRRLKCNLETAGFLVDRSKYVIFLPQKLRRLLPDKFEDKFAWCPLGAQYWIAAKA